MGKKPKIKALSIKYRFSLLSKSEIENIRNHLISLSSSNNLELKEELSSIKTYYEQRLPIELCKLYLGLPIKLPKKFELTDNDILLIASSRHQKSLLLNCVHQKSIKHIIDGLEYPCRILYNSPTCLCGVRGYVWDAPNKVEYKRSYWLQEDHMPLINIFREPTLTMLDEYNIIQNYVADNPIIIRLSKVNNLIWIHNRILNRRISVYPKYYKLYWQWEKYDEESEPVSINEWREYFTTSGCANHRDMIETVHMVYCHKINDLRYGTSLKNMKKLKSKIKVI